MRFGAAIPCRNEFRWLKAVLGQLLKSCDRVLILRGEKTLAGKTEPLLKLPALDPRVEVVQGDWDGEAAIRNAGAELLGVPVYGGDCDYVFHVDSDEIFSLDALERLKNGCKNGYSAIACRMHTYWKTPEYRIDPPEDLIATVVAHHARKFSRLRQIEGTQVLADNRFMHHLSYVRTDEEVRDKIKNFGHAAEVVPGWYERIWKGWDRDRTMENLHPTHPRAYRRAIRCEGFELAEILNSYGVA